MVEVSRLIDKIAAFFSRLQVRLAGLILFLLLPAVFLALLTTAAENQIVTDAASQQALMLAQLTAANQEQVIEGTERILLALSQIPEVRNGETAACNALFVRLRERYQSYTNFYMVDLAGETVCTGLPDAPAVNVSERGWFLRAQQTLGFSISDYSLGAVTGRPIITLSYPIYDEYSNRKYFVATALDLAWMNSFIQQTELPPHATLTAIDRLGTILYRYPEEEHRIGQLHSNEELIETVIAQEVGITQAKGLDQSDRLYGFAALDRNASAFVLVGLPEDTILAQNRVILLQNLFGLFVIGGITLVIAFYQVDRFLTRPIQVLVHATTQLADNKLKTRIPLARLKSTNELSTLGTAFNEMAAALDNAQEKLELRVRERTRELRILAEASATLASSLNYEITLKSVTKLLVPDLADWCTIDLLVEGRLERLVIAHIDPEKLAWAEEVHRLYPPDPKSDTALYDVLQRREAALYSKITTEMVKAAAQDERHFDALQKIGFVSCMIIPLMARNNVLGVITLISSDPTHKYTENDLHLAKDIARRAAVTIDNALLYQELQKQREQLQVTLSSIGDAVIATDMDGRIVFINPIAQQLTRWDEAGAIGKLLPEVFHIVNETTRSLAENPVEKVLREGSIVGLANHTILIASDGTEIPIDDSGAPIFDEHHKLIGVILVFRDITERRKSERQIELLLKLAAAFSQALRAKQIAEIMVEEGLQALGAVIGILALLVDNGKQLEIINRQSISDENFEQYRYTPLEFVSPLHDAVRTDSVIWISSFAEYVALYPHLEQGATASGSRSVIAMPLRIDGNVIGGLSLSFPHVKERTDQEVEFFMALAQLCAQALERALLYEKVQETATLEERQRLARDLHDAVSQVLFSSTSIAESLPRIWQRDAEKALKNLEHVVILNRAAMAEMRSLLLELRPEAIIKTNLKDLLEQLLRALKGRKVIETRLILEGGAYILPTETHIAFYRIAQEALNNIIKHSAADQVTVKLVYSARTVEMHIIDNGQGFNSAAISPGFGLHTMRERAVNTNIQFELQSQPGEGTQISLIWQIP